MDVVTKFFNSNRNVQVTVRHFIAVLLLACLGVPAHSHVDYDADDRAEDLRNIEACRSAGQGVHAIGQNALCFDGATDEEIVDTAIEAIDSEVSTVYLKSVGGSSAAAMALGRALFEKEMKLVVYDFCFSSCANYIIPAAKRLVVADGALVGMHGSMPRSILYYLGTLRTGSSTSEAGEDPPTAGDAIAGYPDAYRKFTSAENSYFVHIRVSEQYVTRYFEIDRNRRLYDTGKCGAIPPIVLIVGPDYLEEFYFGTVLDFPFSRKAIRGNSYYHDLSNRFSVVWDAALFPSSTPENDDLNIDDCFDIR